MSSAFERRAQRMRGIADEMLLQSKRVIWCYEPEKMPALIDLLVARGELSEADRPHCVHWSTLKRPIPMSREEVVKMVDADEMLDAAGIRTLMAAMWDACMQGPDAMKACWRDRFGELGAEDLEILEGMEREVQTSKMREWTAAVTRRPETCISHCK